MRKPQIVVMSLALLGFSLAAVAGEESGSAAGAERPPLCFTSIDVPGATQTGNAMGINARRDVVGGYTNASGTHGYLLSDGLFTTIDFPGAVYTDARGINARGEIVGGYRLAGEPGVNMHGYLRNKDGHFVPLDFPGHTNTIPQRISQNGLVVGCRHDTDTMETMRGVMMNARDAAEFDEIDAFASMSNGVTPDGSLIVGFYTDMDASRSRGYLLYGDTFIPFDVPGSTSTAAWDVNSSHKVVGVYRDAAGFHGFLWDNLVFYAINYPGAIASRAFGINSRGDIVGNYADASGRVHGFLATAGQKDCR